MAIKDIIFNLFSQFFISSLHKYARTNPIGKPNNNNKYNIKDNICGINYLSCYVF